ncbi:centrosomal protein of 152 kDa isoform X3 [Cygnus olor]|uniref:centrosomal protein of 152 kDa isoform X3 n=1 Tax=Cygnus olor TaxID=8869 RepID=UPI001ADE5F36|nr:centrosomal protein of 152 kDa isoform X3 [Cygnus olor]
MSLDFDSGALQTQHDDEDYDQEDYAREQELQQLLTDLPHDMLEDSGDQLSSYSDCSIHESEEQSVEPQKPDGRWNDHPLIVDPQNQFVASEVVSGQSAETYKVTYKPYQNGIHQKIPVTSEGMRRNEMFEDLQNEFLGNDENSSENMQILQLQALNKARERQLEELNEKLEKSAQQIRYLSHQLSMVKDEKDGLAVSLHESQKLYQNGKEREVHLEGQIKALETQIQTLTAKEEQILKQSKVAEVAMESMQKQLLELQRSDALQRAREQHDAIISALKQKHEKQVLSLEQNLDVTKSALREQKELCKNLGEHIKQLEKMLEETKCEKTEIINRLTRSLEESQKQCANLLQTGSIQETNQLRFQLQQAQSAHMISNNMNKALQEELMELKEEITFYESAAKYGVFLNDAGGELHTNLSDSYVDLGIKKITQENSRFCSIIQNRGMDEELSKDEIIVELKAELERLLSSNKMKRNQITQLQNDLKDCQKTLEEFKQLLKAEKASKESEAVKNTNDPLVANPLVLDNLKEEVWRLRKENETLLQEVQKHTLTIEELKENEEKLKNSNLDLCCQMRKIVQDFDENKQEALDRCERTYQRHHEDMKAQFEKELIEKYAAENQQLLQSHEERVSQLKATIEELNREMTTVKECYIAVCGEKDTLEATLKQKFEQEQQLKEEKLKKWLLEEKEESLNLLRSKLEEKYSDSMRAAKQQWLKEKGEQVEKEVALAKVHWEKEEKKNIEQVIGGIEGEWRNRLEEMRRTVADCNDCGSQTDRVTVVDDASFKELARIIADQKLQIEKALKENMSSEEALREFEIELENKYCKHLAIQVEEALTQARDKWLQVLRDLREYKVNVKTEEEKCEREHQGTAAKQLALILSAAEEKWKKEHENTERSGARMKELEEKVVSLRKELELKKEEMPAAIKAELARARAQWNKEKQEEILRIQEQNERDYRFFLDDHRNKINEVLATAKEDLAKQKNSLSAQKEAEMKMLLDQKQREWEAQETKRLQDEISRCEEKILVELEHLLQEVHEELVECAASKCSWEDRCSDAPDQLNNRCKGKLKACLQKAYRRTVHTILEKDKQEWKEKYEELVSSVNKNAYPSMPRGTGETGDLATPPSYGIGQQAETQRKPRRCPPLQRTGTDGGNEKFLEALTAENSEVKAKLRDLGTPPRSLSDGGVSKPCTSCCPVKGLEEMRALYITTVSKIKSDMLNYIRGSKERAAAMIRVEVLRERQETARKMRKYYLTCLQQLLTDNGNYEGAEKKIMNAASKLVTMAKGLETPLRHTSQSKTTRSALLLNFDLPTGGEYSKRDGLSQSRLNRMESKSCGKSITEKANDKVVHKFVPRDLRQQFDAMQAETQHMLPETDASYIQNGNNTKNLVDFTRDHLLEFYPNEDGSREEYSPIINVNKPLLCATSNLGHQNASPSAFHVKLENMHADSLTDGLGVSGPSHHMLKNQNERLVLKEDECIPSCGNWKTTAERTQDSDFHKIPGRDESSCSEWNSVNGSLCLDSSNMPVVHPEQKPNANVQAKFVSCEESFSTADESVRGTWRELTNGHVRNLKVKNSSKFYSRGQMKTNPERTSFLGSDKSNSAVTQLSVLPNSNARKCCKKYLEKNVMGSPGSSAR